MSKDNFTDGFSFVLGEKSDRPKIGRPATSGRRIAKSSQEGVKENETRATFIVNEEYLEKLKAIAYWERKPLKSVINNALSEYINKANVRPRPEEAKCKDQETSRRPIKVIDKKLSNQEINISPKTIEGIRFLTILDAAETLHVTPQTIRAYIKQGKLKGQRIGRPILITESNLIKFIQADNQ
jgi:excisionase family DNA binding protein